MHGICQFYAKLLIRAYANNIDVHVFLLLMTYRSLVQEATSCLPAEYLEATWQLPIDMHFGRPEDGVLSCVHLC